MAPNIAYAFRRVNPDSRNAEIFRAIRRADKSEHAIGPRDAELSASPALSVLPPVSPLR